MNTWCLVVIYIECQSAVDSLQWDVESISEFDFEGVSTSVGPNGPHSKLIFIYGMVYKGWVGYQFTFVHKWCFGNYVRLHKDK